MTKRRKARGTRKPTRPRVKKRAPRKPTRAPRKPTPKPKPRAKAKPPKRKQSTKGLTQPFAPKRQKRPKREGGKFHAESRAIAKDIKKKQNYWNVWEPRNRKNSQFSKLQRPFVVGKELAQRKAYQRRLEKQLLNETFPIPLEFDIRKPFARAYDRPNYRYRYIIEGLDGEIFVRELLRWWGKVAIDRPSLEVRTRVTVSIRTSEGIEPQQSSAFAVPQTTLQWMDERGARPSWERVMREMEEKDETIRIVWTVDVTTNSRINSKRGM